MSYYYHPIMPEAVLVERVSEGSPSVFGVRVGDGETVWCASEEDAMRLIGIMRQRCWATAPPVVPTVIPWVPPSNPVDTFRVWTSTGINTNPPQWSGKT